MVFEPLGNMIDDLAEKVGSPLVLEDERQQLVIHSPHHEVPDDARRETIMARSPRPEVIAWCRSFGIHTADGPVRTPRNDTLGLISRVCMPVRFQGTLVGYIWAIDDPPLPEDAVEAIVKSTKDIASALYRINQVSRARSDLFRDLVSSSPEVQRAAASDLGSDTILRLGTRAVILVVRGTSFGAVESLLRREAASVAWFTDNKEMVVLVDEPKRQPGTARKLAGLILAHCRADDLEPVVGLSSPHSGLDLHTALMEASDAARVGDAIPSVGRLAEWSTLGIYRILARAAVADGEVLADPRINPLLEHPELLHTLETYFDLACRAKATADVLHVHRTTLYYRLAKIETLTGTDLSTGGDRLSLHAAVKLRRLQERIQDGSA